MGNLYSLDTNIVSNILRKNPKVIERLKTELQQGNEFTINPMTYYEIMRGLIYVNSKKKLGLFQELYKQQNKKLHFDKQVFDESIKIHCYLRSRGITIEDADIFIGSISLINNCILVTNNKKHLSRIKGLKIDDWL